jgi:hypothetical protein
MKSTKNNQPEFWVINISKQNVSLSDLRLTIPAGRSFNLLDSRHFNYSADQLEKSMTSGSLFKKSDKIKRRGIPKDKKPQFLEVSTDFREVRRKSLIRAEIDNYDELPNMYEDQLLSDQKFAEEYADDNEFK